MLASWFAPEWIVRPLHQLLTVFLNLTGSYGMSIILLTVVVRVVILPLTFYQMKSMKKMQEVQPRMKEMQDKYKDQPEKLNQEMMQLYKTEGVNPFAGCLPMFIQLPILYALFAVLQSFDPTTLGYSYMFLGLNLAHKELILTVLTVVSMFAQSYLSSAPTDPNQKIMTYMMPLMFGWIAFSMPQSGILLYWVVSTVFGLVQQAIYPGFPRLKGAPGAKGEA